ncbi:MAG: sulfite exporter TauE/SafE family protein [Gemmatimonadales bacterium]
MLYYLLLAGAGVLAGSVAAVSGFGIGSLLTPVLALQIGTKLAVAAIAIPHAVGTAQRFWLLRRHVDWRVARTFGITSAIGGLAGALLQARASGRALQVVFGTLLVLAGTTELTGWMQKVRWSRSAAWVAGALSGVLGGLVGNQGGIRTAAMLGYHVPKESFVATATLIALLVDAARLPVYLLTQGEEIAGLLPQVLIATAAVMVGTFLGRHVLGRLTEAMFRRLIALLLLGLGGYMLLGRNSGIG